MKRVILGLLPLGLIVGVYAVTALAARPLSPLLLQFPQAGQYG